MIFITNNNSMKVLKSGEQPFNFPTLSISSQDTAVLCSCLFPIALMRRNQINTTFFGQLLVKLVDVIGSVHYWKRRWQVLLGGYRSGRSLQGAPVRNIQRMPLSTARQSCGSRPDFQGWVLGFGIYSAIRCHRSFVMSIFHISALTYSN